jgi:hypothetical protein
MACGSRSPRSFRLAARTPCGAVHRFPTGRCSPDRVPTPHRLPVGHAQEVRLWLDCHRRFKEWCAAGVFTKVFSKFLKFYDRRRGIQWKWSSLDSAMVKAPKGGAHGPEPDRPREKWRQTPHSDRRTGRSAGRRNPGANVHDKWLVGQMLDAVVLRAPRGPRRPEHLCLDKGYDCTDAEAAVRAPRITPHIRRIGEQPLLGCVQGKPGRWVRCRRTVRRTPCRKDIPPTGSRKRAVTRARGLVSAVQCAFELAIQAV